VLSEAAPETIRRAQATHTLTAVQSEYSLFSRDPEAEVLPVLRELGIGFVAYSPLGRGLLTGVIKREEDLPDRDWRRSVPRFRGDNLVHNAELVAELERLAERRAVTVGQLALAWVLHQGQDIVPIPGTRRRKNLELNVATASTALDAGDLAEIDAIVSPEAVAGRRGNSAYMERVNG
jgi:aryl-alcohol dehydrogenase-like predicted oxidoreductase